MSDKEIAETVARFLGWRYSCIGALGWWHDANNAPTEDHPFHFFSTWAGFGTLWEYAARDALCPEISWPADGPCITLSPHGKAVISEPMGPEMDVFRAMLRAFHAAYCGTAADADALAGALPNHHSRERGRA